MVVRSRRSGSPCQSSAIASGPRPPHSAGSVPKACSPHRLHTACRRIPCPHPQSLSTHGFPCLHLQTRSDLGMSPAGCLVDTAEPVPPGALGGFSLEGVNPASCACGWPCTQLFLLSPLRARAPARPKIYAYVIRQGIEMALSTWRAPQEKTDNVKTHVSDVSRATGTPRTRRRG